MTTRPVIKRIAALSFGLQEVQDLESDCWLSSCSDHQLRTCSQRRRLLFAGPSCGGVVAADPDDPLCKVASDRALSGAARNLRSGPSQWRVMAIGPAGPCVSTPRPCARRHDPARAAPRHPAAWQSCSAAQHDIVGADSLPLSATAAQLFNCDARPSEMQAQQG